MLDERLSRLLLGHRARSRAFAKKFAAAEVTRLEREHEAVRLQAQRPGHSGVELVAEGEHADAQRLQHGCRCLPAGNDERPDAPAGQCDRERAEGLLDETRGRRLAETLLNGLHLAGFTARIEKHAAGRDLVARPVDEARQLVGVLGDLHGINLARRHQSSRPLDLRERRGRTAATQHRDRGANAQVPIILPRLTRAVVHAREGAAEGRAAGHQPQPCARFGDHVEMTIEQRVDNGNRVAGGGEVGEPAGDRARARLDGGQLDQPDRRPHLAAKHSHQIRVAHRRQWVMAHRRIGEELIAHEQMAGVDRTRQRRIGRARNREGALQPARAARRSPGRCCRRRSSRRSSST